MGVLKAPDVQPKSRITSCLAELDGAIKCLQDRVEGLTVRLGPVLDMSPCVKATEKDRVVPGTELEIILTGFSDRVSNLNAHLADLQARMSL